MKKSAFLFGQFLENAYLSNMENGVRNIKKII